MNSLVDKDMIEKLYETSEAGVKNPTLIVKLFVLWFTEMAGYGIAFLFSI